MPKNRHVKVAARIRFDGGSRDMFLAKTTSYEVGCIGLVRELTTVVLVM